VAYIDNEAASRLAHHYDGLALIDTGRSLSAS
jgi:hypothetical protein